MKKALKIFIALAAAAFAALLFIPSTGASASAKGPYMNVDSYAFLRIVSNDSAKTETYLLAGKATGYKTSTVKNAKYDLETNTLTLTNFDALCIATNMMGEDFKIELVGKNTLCYLVSWGDYYGGNVIFTGKGSLTLTDPNAPLTIEAEYTDSAFYFQDSVSVTAPNVEKKNYAVEVYGTKSKKAINVDEGLTVVGTDKRAVHPYGTYDFYVEQLIYPATKDGKKYYYAVDWSHDQYIIYNWDFQQIGTISMPEQVIDQGYIPLKSDYNNIFCGYKGTFAVGPKIKQATSAPSVSVKVDGTTAKFSVNKTKGAEGYEVRIVRNNDVNGIIDKTIKQSGSKKRTLSVKNLKIGNYYANIIPYKTVSGKKVYGTESKTLYFEIK